MLWEWDTCTSYETTIKVLITCVYTIIGWHHEGISWSECIVVVVTGLLVIQDTYPIFILFQLMDSFVAWLMSFIYQSFISFLFYFFHLIETKKNVISSWRLVENLYMNSSHGCPINSSVEAQKISCETETILG